MSDLKLVWDETLHAAVHELNVRTAAKQLQEADAT
jgi:hypothetical protein